MEERIDFTKIAPEPLRLLQALDRYVYASSLERSLIDLVKLRAAQINGCEHSMEAYSKNLLKEGEDPNRLTALPGWREASLFTERERAALTWAEAVTQLSGIPSGIYEEVREAFTEEELVDLTYVLALVNAWNRLTVPFGLPPGTFIPARTAPYAPTPPPTSEHFTWTTEEQEITH